MSRSCQRDNLTIRTYSCTHTFLSNQKANTGSFDTWKCRAIEGDKASKQVNCPSLKLLMLVHFTRHNSAYHCRASWVCVSPYSRILSEWDSGCQAFPVIVSCGLELLYKCGRWLGGCSCKKGAIVVAWDSYSNRQSYKTTSAQCAWNDL